VDAVPLFRYDREMTRTIVILTTGVALLGLPAAASAQGCKNDKRPVPGTLAAANDPCAQPKAAPKREAATEEKKKEQPGMFKSGNTTFYFGGSVSTEVGVRGR
jgi:hypothetical protein